MPAPGVKDTAACLCEEEVIFLASSKERERRFTAGNVYDYML